MVKHTLAWENASDAQALLGRALVEKHRAIVVDLLDEKWSFCDLLRFAAISWWNSKHHLAIYLIEVLNL
ncbi:uncharacterized protein PITG_15823 [Phytophthora infestans T30-4]|uniref:Uncharacterized protein n=1 Tax=Phytophthora infestans (strain T30-4) TaxID=403677 RepID=D0NS74_PHYIT|nr:uncharacterized protein PITG_15823 [Phytophthora infestans T30-4]EEY63478.1 hypothetical protein PITG_15823 [Phytophthora infestans T30-4]|eukprot:XP_002898065.1 hypothetical protein PITG_15823 [Phytophthora infestans T30-4]